MLALNTFIFALLINLNRAILRGSVESEEKCDCAVIKVQSENEFISEFDNEIEVINVS